MFSLLTVLYREMQKKTVSKSKFSQTNDNRFYFADEITSLPLFLPDLKELTELKRKVGQGIDIFLARENLLKTGNKAQELNESLFLYHQVFMNEPQIFLFNQKENFVREDKLIKKSTKKSFYMEKGYWRVLLR